MAPGPNRPAWAGRRHNSVVLAVILAAALGQAGLPATAETDDLARIRRELADSPSLTEAAATARDPEARPVFRVRIRAPLPKPRWEGDGIVPGYVRPFAPTYHHQFLEQVTHEYFRASTLYPVGIPVLPLLKLLGAIGPPSEAAIRRREEKARKEIRAELDTFLRSREIR
jgi:hypothetical protein